jgi:membrane-associated phospholipid phosphatase
MRRFPKLAGLVLLLSLSTTVFSQTQGDAKTEAAKTDSPSSESAFRVKSFSHVFTESNDGFLAPGEDPQNRLGKPFLGHLLGDQVRFWTSPKELTTGGAKTFLPFAGFSGLLIGADSWISKQVPDAPSQLKRSKDISNYAVYSLVGAAGGAFVLGHMKHNDHLSETGLLSGEAALNSTAVTYALKSITRRQRPFQGDGTGAFFSGGDSFTSGHAAVAWSIASVVAHEYPGPLTKLAAYGLASAVTLTRVTSKQHFASDAFIGSALGWYIGRQVYRAHHDPELGGGAWGEFIQSKPEGPRNPANMGSPYVPLDSWVYPALERLTALGYVQTAYLGMRPWTRMECARLLEEAGGRMRYDGGESESEPERIYSALMEEFSSETARLNGAANVGVSLDSIYTRFTGISGTPLRDGYHFGQTIINDYGRPYGEGFNNVTGFSSHAVAGPFSFYVRGEYQHAPELSSYPLSVQQAIANADFTAPLANATAEVNRFHLIDASVALTFHNVQISFGKQSLWLGPGESGPLLFSNNADSAVMLKIDSISPYRLPLLSHILGPVRTEFFLGQLSGHQFEFDGATNALLGPGGIDPQPYLHGTKISFKPTPNLEFGMGITAQFAGPGLPFTWGNFARTFYSHTSGADNPGKRLSAFDFSYRVPGLRKWLTIYNDSLVVDEFSPIGSSRPTLNPGFYLPQIPKIPKLEFRAEYLRSARSSEFAPGFVYYGLRRFRSGYTNDGNLLASWIGRAGQGGQAWLTYSHSPRSRVQIGYRHQAVNKDFISGGRLVDYSARGEMMLSHDLGVSGSLQYEQWRFPVLSPAGHSDVAASFQFTFYPKWRIRK